MTLIKSISGIRGTIGGESGNNLTPIDVIKFTTAFAEVVKEKTPRATFVVGRDARISGEMVSQIVCGALQSVGCNVIDIGLTTTPTIELSIPHLHADAGIMITASHNPIQWNALKLLNRKGEFISDAEGKNVLERSEKPFCYAEALQLGKYTQYHYAISDHIKAILNLDLVDTQAIVAACFSVAVDAVNSTGGIAVVALLEALGVKNIHPVNCTPDGMFAHNPEPLPENLTEIAALTQKSNADIGFAVDPDVDRLAIIAEDGSMFGEEYTLVAVADYVLQHRKGNTVSNMSSSRALRDVTEKFGGEYFASAVGEVNVVEMMKKHQAVIGGEGNGGVIYPDLHYGRDALVGIALILSYLAKTKQKISQLKKNYPYYFISKNKIELHPNTDVDAILKKVEETYQHLPHSTIDGLKINFDETKEWVHLRKSNTEPIIRVYAESADEERAKMLAQRIIDEITAHPQKLWNGE
ncbi:MAG: phosphoglucosamine mutase [Bacteroidales bacterium]|nr:phosphoglucosamine mutase [Bacteroidales bacterium]